MELWRFFEVKLREDANATSRHKESFKRIICWISFGIKYLPVNLAVGKIDMTIYCRPKLRFHGVIFLTSRGTEETGIDGIHHMLQIHVNTMFYEIVLEHSEGEKKKK